MSYQVTFEAYITLTKKTMEYFVSTSGHDDNSGQSMQNAFASITKGINALTNPGDILTIDDGHYFEFLNIRQKFGTIGNPIIIRANRSGRVFIDGLIPSFLQSDSDNPNWIKASEWPDLEGVAHPDEYISAHTVPVINPDGVKGAFFTEDIGMYRRLINHGTLMDLRSENQRWGFIHDAPDSEHFTEAFKNKNGISYSPPRYRPWVYMGPGLWLNKITRHLHIRLSHTNHAEEGITNYTGELNPNLFPLAISLKSSETFSLINCHYVKIEGLVIRYGGEYSALIKNTEHTEVCSTQFMCSENGLRYSDNSGLKLSHCVFDGGLPSWFFRSDRKDNYYYRVNNEIVNNKLGSNTSGSLLVGNPNNTNVTIQYCDFLNGHDLYLEGQIDFHHNYMFNMNDDGVFLAKGPNGNIHIHHNVIQKTLTCFSQAEEVLPGSSWFIYNNLIDLRLPTASFRPRHPLAAVSAEAFSVWRYGWFYKFNGQSDHIHWLFNTLIIVNSKSINVSFNLFSHSGHNEQRSVLNNIFIAFNFDPEIKKPISYLPIPPTGDVSDGNIYYRIGNTEAHLFIHKKYISGENQVSLTKFNSLTDFYESHLYEASKVYYPPGIESNSQVVNPLFKRMRLDGLPQPNDDFRLKGASPAKRAAIALPFDFPPLQGVNSQPDMGCFTFRSKRLKVGFHQRHQFPT